MHLGVYFGAQRGFVFCRGAEEIAKISQIPVHHDTQDSNRRKPWPQPVDANPNVRTYDRTHTDPPFEET